MQKTIGLCLAAIAATASLAIAGGGGEKERAKAKKIRNETDTRTLEKLAATVATTGATVTTAPGEGITFAAGDSSVNMSHRVQLAWTYNSFEGATPSDNSFDIRQARTTLSGNAYGDNNTYNVQLVWGGDAGDQATDGNVLDAWFDTNIWSGDGGSIGLRLGRQKPHHGQEFSGSSANLEHTTRSLASQAFSGNRTHGAFLHGTHMEGGMLNWWAGLGNNDAAGGSTANEGGSADNPDNALNAYFDVSVSPFGSAGDVQADLGYSENAVGTIGVSLQQGNHQDGTGVDIESQSVNVYTNWHYQGMSVRGEIFNRTEDQDGSADADFSGLAVGVGYAMAAAEEGGSQWGFAGRYSSVEQDDGASSGFDATGGTTGDQSALTLSVTNYYHANNMKSTLSFTRATDSPTGAADTDDDQLDLVFQWAF